MNTGFWLITPNWPTPELQIWGLAGSNWIRSLSNWMCYVLLSMFQDSTSMLSIGPSISYPSRTLLFRGTLLFSKFEIIWLDVKSWLVFKKNDSTIRYFYLAFSFYNAFLSLVSFRLISFFLFWISNFFIVNEIWFFFCSGISVQSRSSSIITSGLFVKFVFEDSFNLDIFSVRIPLDFSEVCDDFYSFKRSIFEMFNWDEIESYLVMSFLEDLEIYFPFSL